MSMPYAVVPGEEELGVQKRCPQCGDWWPAMDPEFWPRAGQQGFSAWCRDCKNLRREHYRARRQAGSEIDYPFVSDAHDADTSGTLRNDGSSVTITDRMCDGRTTARSSGAAVPRLGRI